MKNRNASIKFSYPEIPIKPLFCTVWGSHDSESPAIRKRPPISRTQSLLALAFESGGFGFLGGSLGESKPKHWKQVEISSKTLENMFFASLLTKNACNTNEKGYKLSVMTRVKIWEILAGVLADGWRSNLLCHSEHTATPNHSKEVPPS